MRKSGSIGAGSSVRLPLPLKFLVAVLLVALLAVGWKALRGTNPPLPQPSRVAPLTYKDALHQVDLQIEGVGSLAKARPDEWLMQERLANGWLRRARLTGSFDDYAQAQAALDRGFATAPKGAGPHLTQAAVAFSLHRLDQTEAMLSAIDHYAVPAERETQDEIMAMRSDIAFYRGQYKRALRSVAAEGPSFRTALYLSRTGDPGTALEQIDGVERAIVFPSAQALAQFALLRATVAIQRGDWKGATAAFDRASQVFPGYWLMEAGQAQMLAVAGDLAGAAMRLDPIARRSNAPEVMDLLAAVYRAMGDQARARLWADKAGAEWNRRVALLPEAAWQHAAEHELAFGSSARAHDLALADYRNRPYGQAATTLAWAEIAIGRPAEALRLLAPLDATGWVSAEHHAAASQAELLLGHPDRAAAERDKALALNPRIFDPEGSLIWIGH